MTDDPRLQDPEFAAEQAFLDRVYARLDGMRRSANRVAEAYGDGQMRLTVEQNVLFRWVTQASLEPFYQRLSAAGLGAPDALTIGDVVSCPGADTCNIAVTQSRGLAAAIGTELEIKILGKLFKATVIPESPYDPENKALRA